jgi:predicted transcriptional regulator
MKSQKKLVKFLQNHPQSSVQDLVEKLNLSRQYIHKILLELISTELIFKTGTPPNVYYSAAEHQSTNMPINIDYAKEKILKDNFIYVNALGELLEGYDAMSYWCVKQKLDLVKTIDEYLLTIQKYQNYFDKNQLINGTEKIKNTAGIEKLGVENLYYLDFYAIERFRKTKLGTLMHYAKQGQNKNLMKMIVSDIKLRIHQLVNVLNVDAILYVPPTIQRKVQIMDYLEKQLMIDKPIIKINKVRTNVIVPQKALSKIHERVMNAKNTFVIPEQKKYNHILIIDDAVGSGATINEIALKIKDKNLAKQITGLAITGSYKGFEVISEV